QPYLPTPARIAGAADLDLALAVPSLAEGRATARGRAAVSRVSVRDGERTVVRIERADASGIDVEWPERVAVGRLALAQPWVLVERDERGALTLRPLLSPASGPATPAGSTPGGDVEDDRPAPAIRMSQLTVEDGGMRVVDRAVSPPFAVDVQPMTVRMQGLSTASGPPARVELRGGVGPGAELTARGTVGPLTGPLRIDVAAEVREFAVPRANPYMLQQAGWKTTEGRLTSSVQARVDGDALSARTDIRISRLRLVRAAPEDGAQARIGLPLNMLTALMKDRRGNIRLSFPVGGTLGDPRFDFSEAIWSAIRTVAVNAITLPVSWIGRVRFTPDSRIERIEIDPVAFEPGASTPTPQGRVQATRLATFLEQLPDVRMALTPVISAQDLAAIKRRAVDAEIERVALEERLSREAAAARLFERTFPGRPAPGSLDSTLGALIERQPVPPSAAAELAEDRVEAVRTAVKEAGIDAARLVNAKAVEREANGGVELEVVAPETERPSRVREALRRLGVPLGAD
ncbi:MAG TPA: DUF748 domain-containing protein, partial [Candidatus Tectomicrobia bacterium]|nr:DUF748 domain-containing protein [Candidatus Tectomicrobia bacterium]